MLDPNTVVTITLAGVSVVGTGASWAISAYVNGKLAPMNERLAVHVSEDTLIHDQVKQSLVELKATTTRMELKIDKIIERG